MGKVLLIGWDGAGWSGIHPLLDVGAMPQLARMVERGVMGELATLTPLIPALLWTSISTGQFADRHAILDAVEPDPVTGGIRAVSRASLRSPHIWEILSEQGMRCQTAGWPVTHPAHSAGICVSDAFARGAAGSISPAELASRLEPMRFRPEEWTGSELALFVPELNRIDQDKDRRLARLAVTLAEAVSVHAAATTLLEDSAWDFTAVWFGALGGACGIFPAETDGPYKDAIAGVYRFLDLLLGRLLELAGAETTVLLVSDRSATMAAGSRGMLCAMGPHIQPDELAFGSSVLDVAPTILALFGFAPADGMAGRAIPEIAPSSLKRPLPASRNERPVDAEPVSDLERELRALENEGYADTVAAARLPEAEKARKRRDFHLACVLIAQGRAAEAVPLLESLAVENPEIVELRMYLCHAYFQSGRFAESRTTGESVIQQFPDSPVVPLARAHMAIAEKDYDSALAHLAGGQALFGITAALDSAIGEAYLKLDRCNEAEKAFHSAIRTDPGMAAAHYGLARAFFRAGQFEDAAGAALDAIRLRYDLPGAHHTLGRALTELGRTEAAAAAFATSEVLRSHVPTL